MTAASGAAGKALLYVGRILTGWSVGASSMLVPIYVAECSPQHVRGRLVGLYEVGVQVSQFLQILRCIGPDCRAANDQFGVMWGFWVNYLVLKTQKGDVQWRLPIALQLLPAFVSSYHLSITKLLC
jgi:MFS family permease